MSKICETEPTTVSFGSVKFAALDFFVFGGGGGGSCTPVPYESKYVAVHAFRVCH
jgi:hypothetical protein